MAAQPFDLEIIALLSQRKLVGKYLKNNPNVKIFKLKFGNKDVVIDKAKVCREIIRRKAISGLIDEAKANPNKLIEFIANPSNTKVVEQAILSLSKNEPVEQVSAEKQEETITQAAKDAENEVKKRASKTSSAPSATKPAVAKRPLDTTMPATRKAQGLAEQTQAISNNMGIDYCCIITSSYSSTY